MGVNTRTREKIVKWNQMRALRFKIGGRHPTSLASIWGKKRWRGRGTPRTRSRRGRGRERRKRRSKRGRTKRRRKRRRRKRRWKRRRKRGRTKRRRRKKRKRRRKRRRRRWGGEKEEEERGGDDDEEVTVYLVRSGSGRRLVIVKLASQMMKESRHSATLAGSSFDCISSSLLSLGNSIDKSKTAHNALNIRSNIQHANSDINRNTLLKILPVFLLLFFFSPYQSGQSKNRFQWNQQEWFFASVLFFNSKFSGIFWVHFIGTTFSEDMRKTNHVMVKQNSSLRTSQNRHNSLSGSVNLKVSIWWGKKQQQHGLERKFWKLSTTVMDKNLRKTQKVRSWSSYVLCTAERQDSALTILTSDHGSH